MKNQVTITIDPALREAVQEIANQERRILSAQMCCFAAAGVAQRKAKRRRLVKPSSDIVVGQ